jgi:two-component system NtrC family sensor kinase
MARELEARERQLVEQRHFIERIVDALPVGLYVVDRDYRVQAWNHTRETGLQGIARGEALGRTIFEILHRQSAESLRREFDDAFATGELRQFETESRASSNGGSPPRTYRISKIPLRLNGDEVTHVITVGEEVTSWKEAEKRVAQAEKLAAIGQLAAGVMHEINNPLATVAACAESMTLSLESAEGFASASAPAAGGVPVAQYLEYLHVIDAEVRRCKGIAEALLNFSRTGKGERAPVDLNAVVEQTMFLLKHHRRFHRRVVRLELERQAPAVVRGNAEQLVQVFMALLHNAADAVEDGRTRDDAPPRSGRSRTTPRASRAHRPANARRGDGSITVRTRIDNGHVVAEVSDGGIGIPRALQSKIFEPFFTTKPTGQGTGLGLSVCYGIVADHGGRLEVESEAGSGTTFRIALPSADAERTQGANGAQNLEGAEA